jgi:AcrR family transcriptional regulator
MAVPRQGASSETGRVRQKQRTRAAIVDAARRLLQDGVTPTVAEAAEAADVSRTTAYRYFPTQESLLLEIAVHADVDDIEALVSEPLDAAGVRDRLLAVLDTFNRHVHAEEAQYRTALRLYLDMWLAAAADGDTAPIVREGRRTRWLQSCLAPLAGTVPDDDLRRLTAALSLVAGSEAMVVLRDVCRLDRDEALDASAWAVAALLDAVAPASSPTGAAGRPPPSPQRRRRSAER